MNPSKIDRPTSIKINPQALEIFICTSPCSIPFPFALHTFFVINDHGTLRRYEILYLKNKTTGTHFHTKTYKDFEGMRIFNFLPSPKYKSTIIYSISDSTDAATTEKVHALKSVLENTEHAYPFINTYSLIGINSNTFARWVIKKSSIDVTLPLNCFGKTM